MGEPADNPSISQNMLARMENVESHIAKIYKRLDAITELAERFTSSLNRQ